MTDFAQVTSYPYPRREGHSMETFDSPLLSRVTSGSRAQSQLLHTASGLPSAARPRTVFHQMPATPADDFTSPPLLPVHRYPSHHILSRLEEQWRQDPMADDPARASHLTSVALGYGLHMAAIGHTATFVVRHPWTRPSTLPSIMLPADALRPIIPT